MEQTLTYEIVCKYPNAKVEYFGKTYNIVAIYKALGGGGYLRMYVNPEDRFEEGIISSCKLILTPLSAISDEDAIEVAKIIIPLPFQKYTKGWVVTRDYAITGYPYIMIHHPKNVFKIQFDCAGVGFDLYNMEDVITSEHPMNYVNIIDYLRSKSYCTEQPADWWIDATTLK